MAKLDFSDFSHADSLREELDNSVSKLLLSDSDKEVKNLSLHCIYLLQHIVEIVATKRK